MSELLDNIEHAEDCASWEFRTFDHSYSNPSNCDCWRSGVEALEQEVIALRLSLLDVEVTVARLTNATERPE